LSFSFTSPLVVWLLSLLRYLLRTGRRDCVRMAEIEESKALTVHQLLQNAARRLEKAGVDDPRLNSELLLGKVLGLTRAGLLADARRTVGPAEQGPFQAFVARRAAREPLQRLLGEWEFCGRSFMVSRAVMIPRQETELVVEACLARIPPGREAWVAEAGTGSGIIAVTLAAERPRLQIIASDVTEEVLETARENARRHSVAERIRFTVGDLLRLVPASLPAGRETVGLVVSNPPYIPSGLIPGLQPEVRDHDPIDSLDGGADGLALIRRLVAQAARVLSPGGWLVMELGEGQAADVSQLVKRTGAFDMGTLDTKRDSGGCERVFCVQRRRN